jgi:RNA polymerase sigma-54 factor
MTPQLIQSIRLLQLTHLELVRFIEEEVERNPLLEIADEEGGAAGDIAGGDDRPSGEMAGSEDGDWVSSGVTADGESVAERLDTSFENVFPDDGVPSAAAAPEFLDNWKSMPGANGANAAETDDLDRFGAGARSLRDHVNEQIAFAFTEPRERAIALELADRLDEAGYIAVDAEALAKRLGTYGWTIEAVLARLQTFDPAGLFARSLDECLAIQLRQKDRLDPAMQTLIGRLDLLARRDFAALTRLCGVDEEDLLDMLAEIRALDPKPGLAFQSAPSEAVVPDIFVSATADGGFRVELNPQTLPRVLVDRSYHAAVSGRASEADRAFLTDCLQKANWLARSLDQRARTMTKVAAEIVRQQEAFLKFGPQHLKPLTLRAIADAIGMHESTVSRATAAKFMLTPRGVFELKYFFTVSIAATEGADAHSAEAVRQAIRDLIAAESAENVLSDDDIVKVLKARGVDIARRTVAKYREAMHIPSSVSRRREKRAMARGRAG